jgi:hypothetical protein
MLPGTILVFLGASDLFLGTRNANMGATLLLGTTPPFLGIFPTPFKSFINLKLRKSLKNVLDFALKP